MALLDRSSRPKRMRMRTTLDSELTQRIEQLRRTRMPMRRIALIVGHSLAASSRLLATVGLSSLKTLDPVQRAVR